MARSVSQVVRSVSELANSVFKLARAMRKRVPTEEVCSFYLANYVTYSNT